MSNGARNEALETLLREGAASYLDALYALHLFKRAVADAVVVVLGKRLLDLVKAVDIRGPTPESITRFCYPDDVDAECDGNFAFIGSRVWFPEPWGENSYLGLSFNRDETGDESKPYVTFSCVSHRSRDFTKLKIAFSDRDPEGSYYADDKEWDCGFTRELQNPATMELEFDTLTDYVIGVWRQIGGWSGLPN
jgi:hypothetical protein